MKSRVLILIVSLLALIRSQSIATELSSASVAERIAKDEGYRLFHFASDRAEPLQVVARFNGREDILNVPSVKEFIIAVRLGKGNALEAVRVYYDAGSVSITFQSGPLAAEFNWSLSGSKVLLNDPFLTLRGPGGELALFLRQRKS
ncbi:MAG TPA: hypothetical protein VIT91_11620 [Chthoniobacterales bacterium]